jgi:hypothetical protein
MRRRRTFRGWAIVWAVLQFALPAAATYADALLERGAATAQGPHVESQSNASCRPVHPAECALCQVVSRNSAPADAPVTCHAIVRVAEQPASAEQSLQALTRPARVSLARAPPLS